MFCENCGAQLQQKDNKLVCPKCGAEYEDENPVQAAAAAAPAPQAEPQTTPQAAPKAKSAAKPKTKTKAKAKTESEDIKLRGFSSKKNILIIIIAAIIVLLLGAGITAIAVTNSPSYKVSHGLEIADHYLSDRNYEQAVIEYEKVLEIEPMNVDAYLGLAKAYEKDGDIDKAIEVLREGLRKTGNKRIERRLNKLLNPETGILSGRICRASDRTSGIPDVSVNIYRGDALYTTEITDEDGNFSTNEIPAGRYYVEATADGYLNFSSYVDVTDEDSTYMETILMIEGEEGETGYVYGDVIDSLTGRGVEDITLVVKKDWNNTDDSADAVATATTDYYGGYSIELPIGNYTVIATKTGYLDSSFNIVVQPGSNQNQNGVIFQEVAGDGFLITLTWGANPRDLDSHVEGTLSNGNNFHVFFEHRDQYDNDAMICNLDYDDTDSFGPEHITLNPNTEAPYYYYIYRYAGMGTVANSGAKITVYKGNRMIAEYNVPTDLGNGDYWNVFAIKDGELIVKNTITEEADLSYAE